MRLPHAEIISNSYPLQVRSDRTISIRAFSNDDETNPYVQPFGRVRPAITFYVNGLQKMYITENTIVAGVPTFGFSDLSLKTNIKTLPRALNKIMRIRGVSYNWTDTNQVQTTQIGVIAQEVEKVYPELVTTVETEDPSTNGKKAVNYTGLIAPLLEAVKAQQRMIRKSEARIKQLEERITQLEAE